METEKPSFHNKPSLIKFIKTNNIPYINIGVFDHNGICRGKIISQEKFLSGLDSQLSFCDVIVGSDIDDQLCDNMQYTGWHTAYPDALLNIIPESYRCLPWQPNLPFFLCEFDKKYNSMCPRSILKNVLAKASTMGFKVKAAVEFEFSLFQESSNSIHEKNFQNLQTLTAGNFGYSVLRSNQYHQLYQSILNQCQQLNIPIECLHTEIGPGVLEAAITVDQALAAADKAALFKTFVKIICGSHNCIATFMAKINQHQQGHSGHTHISLTDTHDRPVFYDNNKEDNISDTLRYFIAGQQKLMPELLALSAPTINSFARLVPGHWAPTQATWGIDNRTCALRVINNSEKSARVEYRIPAADCNPYLAMAAAIASGLYGIENKLEPSEPIEGNAYTQNTTSSQQLPSNLLDAANCLYNSTIARKIFGDDFINDYTASRQWEARQYQAAITDWQIKRYFEII